MALSKEDFIKEVETMTVVELNELVEALKEKFNVSAAPVAAAGGVAASGGEEEKSSFDVILKETGSNKIAVIKEIKAIVGVGLKESKALADNPGQALKEGVDKATAEEIKEKLEAAGATVELK
jgi:large subunit ribosomal protein L7/L12